MNITTDEETFSDIEMVRRNLAHFAPLKTTFRARPEVNARIMERIAQTFKVYQYVHEEDGGIKYTEPWELFFWWALRIFRDCSGKVVEYNGKRGHLKWSERNGYYFMALRARKMGYILINEAVCRYIKEIAA